MFASQHGLNSPESDVACVTFTLNTCRARSARRPLLRRNPEHQGRAPTTASAHWFYIATLSPDDHETSQQQEQFPATPVFEHTEVADGRQWLKASGIHDLPGDLPKAEQNLVPATGAVPDADLFNQQVPGTAWKTEPSWYIVANDDRTVSPDRERFSAKRMGARTYDVDSSHVPTLSYPSSV